MGLYVYGIIPRLRDDPPLSGAAGVAGASVYLLTRRDLAAVVSDVPDGGLANPSARQLRRDLAAHADVLNRLATQTTVLPFQFGVIVRGAAALTGEVIDPHYDALCDGLRRVAGAVEVTFKAAYVEEAILTEIARERPPLRPRQAGGSRAGLADRVALGEQVALAVQDHKEQEARRLLEELAPVAREAAVTDTGMDLTVLRASFLIDRDRLDEFDRVVSRLQSGAEHRLRVACVGPLPPYSFARLGSPADQVVGA